MQPSLVDSIRDVAQAAPSRTCFVSKDGRITTYSKLLHRVDVLVQQIIGMNVISKENNRVAIFAADSIDVIVAYLAIIDAGATVVAVNNLFRTHEIQNVVKIVNPVLWIVDISTKKLLLDSVLDQESLMIYDLASLNDAVFPNNLEKTCASNLNYFENPIDIIAFTSGTTGLPKAVAMSRGALREMIAGVILSYRIAPCGRCLYTAMMAFVPTVLTQILGHLCTGGTIFIPKSREIKAVVQQIIDLKISYVYIPSPWLSEFLDLAESDPRVLNSGLMAVMHAGSSVPSSTLERALTIFGNKFVEAWGMTETCGMPITAYVPEDLVNCDSRYLAGTVGRNLPSIQVRVGFPAELFNVEGDLFISGACCFDGYWEDGKVLKRDLWFETGDVGTIDSMGFVTLTGRSKEMIISGGANVSPLEVEDCVLHCAGVVDAAVFGIDDSYWGEVVCLAIVVDNLSDLKLIDEIMSHCRSNLARYKVPKKIAVMNELPRTASQKLKRVLIKEMFISGDYIQLREEFN